MQDCCSAPGLLPVEQAISAMLSQVEPLLSTEHVPLNQANGRVLAEPVLSPVNVPPADNSAMDGYAFRSQDAGKALFLAGRAMAGAPYNGRCEEGQCIRIMTGAVIPQGCDQVAMQENCVLEADTQSVAVPDVHKPFQHIRKAGEDVAAGAQVFAKGQRLSAVDIGVLAALGVAQVCVFKPVKVAVLATGDELVEAGKPLLEGQIYESNSAMLCALLSDFGAEVKSFGIIKDVPQDIEKAFTQANEWADVVISSGGVSVGDADFVKDTLDKLGQVNFWKVAIKPGKPFAFGKLSNSIFFGLPGNPVSAIVTAHQLVMPVLACMQGEVNQNSLTLKAKVTHNIRKGPGRADFQRGIASINEVGELEVVTTGSQGSGILTSVSKANCYITLSQEQGSVDAGEFVTIQLFDRYLKK